MMPVSRRQAGWLPCLDPIVCLDKLRGVVSNRSTNIIAKKVISMPDHAAVFLEIAAWMWDRLFELNAR